MMQEYLAFLLPLAAASGWWVAARHYARKVADCSDSPLNRAYFRGLNYLLNEKPEKAIDVFVGVLKPDCEVFDTHIALGILYRRRGEVERAIDIHKNLLEKTTLTPPQRAHALFELATDFMQAGLFGRSEELFSQLLDAADYREKALRHLLYIVQQEKDWSSSIRYIRALSEHGKIERGESVAQFYCEMAKEASTNGQEDDEALRYLERALVSDQNCVRASLMKSGHLMRKGDYQSALVVLKKVEQQNYHYIREIIDPILECYKQMGREQENMEYLRDIYERYRLESAARAISRLIWENEGIDEAVQFFSGAIDGSPTLKGLHHLIQLSLSEGDESGGVFSKLENLSAQLVKRCKTYQCAHCGFSCFELYWCCPGCQHWETIRPVEEMIKKTTSNFMAGIV